MKQFEGCMARNEQTEPTHTQPTKSQNHRKIYQTLNHLQNMQYQTNPTHTFKSVMFET
jgi:ribosomal 50S subunit-associated protein YjgA (DUF615 family)